MVGIVRCKGIYNISTLEPTWFSENAEISDENSNYVTVKDSGFRKLVEVENTVLTDQIY